MKARGVAAALAIALAAWLAVRSPTSVEARPDAGAVSLLHGETFDLSVTGDEERSEPLPLRASLRLDARLFLATREERGERVVHAKLEQIRAASLAVAHDDASPPADLARALADTWALVTLRADGSAARIAFAEGATPAHADLLSAIFSRIFARVPRAGCETERAPHALGTLTVRACARGDGEATREVLGLEPDVSGEPRVESEGRRTTQGGLPRTIDEREVVVVEGPGGAPAARARFALRLAPAAGGASEDRASASATFVERDAAARERALERQMLERRAAGLSGDELVTTLDRFGAAGVVPDHARFLWRGAARLRLEPERAAALARTFARGDMSTPGRALVFDLLAFAGTEEGQRTMRELLATPAASEDADAWPELVQRFGFVARPSRETAAWLSAQHRAARVGSDRWIATAYALGAVLRRAEPSGETAAHLATLMAELDAAQADDARAHLVRALGNAGAEASVPHVLALTTSDSALVRAAAAAALRHVPSEATTAALVRLVGDRSEQVAREALSSLGARPLGAADLDGLAAAAERFGPPMASALVTFLSQRRGDRALAERAFAAMLARARILAGADARLEARIEALGAEGTR